MTVKATILVPTFDHADTLPLAVRSALAQTERDLEILIIGDGVTPHTRAAAEDLVASDDRVRFLDFPKGPHHGEIYRHEAIAAARSSNIFYLCDDDLLLPNHVGDLLQLLEDCNFAQSRNGYFKPDGELQLFVTDLSDPQAVWWHLLMPPRNRVSLTGTAHRKDFYLSLERGWETTPKGFWPDHFMWMKFFRQPDFKGATSKRMTALQLPTSADGRDEWTSEQRLAELSRWAEIVAAPDGQAQIDEIVDTTARRTLQRTDIALDMTYRQFVQAEQQLAAAQAESVELRAEADRLQAENDRLRAEVDRLREGLTSVLDARSWRFTAPLRAVRARMTR